MPRPRKTKTAIGQSRAESAIRFAPNPLPQLTPVNLTSYLESFARGYLRDTALLWETMQIRDDRVGSDSNKRYKSIARHGYKVLFADGVDAKDKTAAKHAEAIKFALENLTARDALDASVRGGVSELCRQMQRAQGFKYQVHELVWRDSPKGLTLDAIAAPLWWFERTTGALRFLQNDFDLNGVDLEPEGWMVTRGDGLMAPTSLLYLLKRMALSDWAAYNGRVGPGIHGSTSAAVGSADWTALEEAVDNFGFDLKLVTQSGVSITPIEMALKGVLPWPEMYRAMQAAITILWRGGNLSSDSGGAPDQTGVTLQGEEKDLIEQDDAESVSGALNDYIVAPLIRYRFGEEPLAWVEWQTGAKPDVQASVTVDDFLARRGFPFCAEDLAERYGRTLPAAGQTILAPPQAAPSFLIPASNARAGDSALEPLLAELEKLLETDDPAAIQAWIDALPKRAADLDIAGDAEALAQAMERAALNALLDKPVAPISDRQKESKP